MSFRVLSDETFEHAVCRISTHLASDTLSLLDSADAGTLDRHVHEVRKNCKKLRGLARLVRPGLGKTYTRTNQAFRDAARELSECRDPHGLLETFDSLIVVSGGQGVELAAVRAGLAERAHAATQELIRDPQPIERARRHLQQGKSRLAQWTPEGDSEAIAEGIARTYGRGRKALRAVTKAPRTEALHELRKRAKYTWYHLRLLENAAPSQLGPLARGYHDLSDALGDDHDLALLISLLRSDPQKFGGDDAVEVATELSRTTRSDLQDRALRLGRRLYVETPERFAGRIVAYWDVWQEHGDERPAGEVGDLYEARGHLGALRPEALEAALRGRPLSLERVTA